jgi:NAD(P)-dependent dehydrogenase (short-subunit alcohol dehydrogenase family)
MPSKQALIHSGFGPATTARETLHGIDLRGKVAVVTGGYSGIGLETTRALADAGATVIVPARNPDKARKALKAIPGVEQKELDLLAPGSIDAFASEFLSSGRPLHMLINNAGIMATPLARDSRGYESQFSANHLGHFQLTARLWPALRNAQGARVVSVSSRAHQRAAMDSTILIFNAALTTDGRSTANRKPQMFYLLWNLIGVAKPVEFARSPFIRVLS